MTLILSLFLALAGLLLAWAAIWLFLSAIATLAILAQFACHTAWQALRNRLTRH